MACPSVQWGDDFALTFIGCGKYIKAKKWLGCAARRRVAADAAGRTYSKRLFGENILQTGFVNAPALMTRGRWG